MGCNRESTMYQVFKKRTIRACGTLYGVKSVYFGHIYHLRQNQLNFRLCQGLNFSYIMIIFFNIYRDTVSIMIKILLSYPYDCSEYFLFFVK